MKTRRKKQALLSILLLLVLLFLSGCGAKISTKLILDHEFSGSRIITCVVSKSDVENNFKGGIDSIDAVISQHCPNNLTYKKTEDNSSYTYTFTLTFSSFEDYKSQVESLLGRSSEIAFRQPNSVFASGAALEEDFSSLDLLDWFKKVVEEDELMSDSSNLWELSDTSVVFNGQEISTGGTIQFNRIESHPITFIQVDTHIGQANCERIVSFWMPRQARGEKQEEVDAYMASLVPQGASGEWVQSKEEDSYIFQIIWTAPSLEGFSDGMVSIFGDEYVCWTELSDNDPFVTSQYVQESIPVSMFSGEADGSLHVYCVYKLDEQDERRLLISGNEWNPEESNISFETYADSISTNFHIDQHSQVDRIAVTMSPVDMDGANIQIDFVFPQDKPNQAEKAANYYKSLWEDVNIERISEEGEICRLTLPENSFDAKNRLTDLLYSDSFTDPSLLVLFQKETFKSNWSLYFECFFDPLLNKAGITENGIDFTFIPSGYKMTQVNLNGEEKMGTSEPVSINARYITLSIEAEKLNTLSVVLLVAGILLLLVALIVGYLFLVKKLAKQDHRQDEPIIILAKDYFLASCRWVWDKLSVAVEFVAKEISTLSGVVADKMQRFYPEGANVKLIRYFYGSRGPFYLALLVLIVFPIAGYLIIIAASLFIMLTKENPLGLMSLTGFILGAQSFLRIWGVIVAIVWYLIDRFRPDSKAELEYDRLFTASMEQFTFEKAMDRLALVPQQVEVAEPLSLVGPDYQNEDHKLKWFKALKRWIRRLFSYEPHLVVKKGSDGAWRYSCATRSIWFLSQNQLYLFKVSYDICTNKIFRESTCETFYQDLCLVESKELQHHSSKSLSKQAIYFQEFLVTSSSGNKMSGSIDSCYTRNEQITQTTLAIQNLVREKKDEIKQKKIRRKKK